MNNDKYEEDQLEQLFKQLPDVSSSVPKEQFRRSVMMEVNRRSVTKKKSNKLFYSLASIGLVAVIGVVSVNLMNNSADQPLKINNTTMQPERALDNYSMKESRQEEVSIVEQNTTNDQQGANISIASNEYHSLSVYESNLPSSQTFIQYDVLDESAQYMVPLTLAVPKEDELTEFELFEKYQESFDEANFHLAETYPLPHKLSVVDNSLYIDVKEEFPNSLGTAGESQFFTLASYFSEEFHFDDVKFYTEGKEGIVFSHIGESVEKYDKASNEIHAYYLYYPNEDQSGTPLIAERFGYMQSLDDAFEMMYSDDESSRVYSAFPDELQFYYVEKDDVLQIHFTNGIDQLNDVNNWYTFDCILAVAKSAGFTGVQFYGLENNIMGPYDFSGIIPVPQAYNQIEGH